MADPNAGATIGLKQLSADLAAASGRPMDDVAKSLVADLAMQVQAFAKAYAPRKTGKLAESIEVFTSGDGMSAVVRPTVTYAEYVEYGTGVRGEFPGKPYTIKPKNPGGVLVFKVGNRTVRAKSVTNPGGRPFPYMRPAAERVATPLMDGLGNGAVLMITKGPNAPVTLQPKFPLPDTTQFTSYVQKNSNVKEQS